MNYEELEAYLRSLARGCRNRLQELDGTEQHNYYDDRYRHITGAVLSVQSVQYNDED
jgi:hypothetical protein